MKFNLTAKTLFGLEEVLAEELRNLGAEEVETGNRAVYFKGDNKVMYEANLWCRTALKILKPIKTFVVNNEEELYKEIKKIKWDTYMSVEDTLAVDAVVGSSNLDHSLYAALKTKDAVVDQFRDKYGERPSVDTKHPTLRINVHIYKENCTVSLDSSGDSLHKRGYREMMGEASLSEVLAAGLILLSGWDKKSNFVDFMCGSATLLIEAALIAKNIAPGSFKKEFGFERWRDFDANLWKNICDEAEKKRSKEFNFSITGVDMSSRSIRLAKENIENAKLSKYIRVETIPFQEFTPPKGGGTVVINPPYGERITVEDINALYKKVGDELKHKYEGYSAWILTSNMEAAKFIGLKPSRKILIFNGQLECKFLKFEIYKGSKKAKKMEVNKS